MEGMKIYDFDSIEEEDRIVKIKKREFKIPGDYPVALLMASQKYSEMLRDNDGDAFEYISKHLYNYFKIMNDISYDEFTSLISINAIPAMLSAIMYDISPEETDKQLKEVMNTEVKKK